MRLTAALLLVLTVAAGSRLEGFSSLGILPGVREAAMGGAGVASASGPQAIALNPAAGAEVRSYGVTAGYTKWLLDTHHQAVFAERNLRALTVGVGAVNFSAGSFEYRTTPTDDPVGTFSPNDFSFYLNVGREFSRFVSAGLTARYFYSKIFDQDANGIGIDLGVRVRPLSGLVLGASVIDFGRTMSYGREVFWLPTKARFGASYDYRPNGDLRVTAALDGSQPVYWSSRDVRAGVEFAWRELAMVRAGYDFLAKSSNVSVGVGVRVGPVRVDYALAPFNSGLGMAHRFGIGIGN